MADLFHSCIAVIFYKYSSLFSYKIKVSEHLSRKTDAPDTPHAPPGRGSLTEKAFNCAALEALEQSICNTDCKTKYCRFHHI